MTLPKVGARFRINYLTDRHVPFNVKLTGNAPKMIAEITGIWLNRDLIQWVTLRRVNRTNGRISDAKFRIQLTEDRFFEYVNTGEITIIERSK